MIRLVLDTNVIVSAHIKPASLEDRVFKLVLEGRVQTFVSAAIMDEYERVLTSPKLSLNKKRVKRSLAALRQVAHLVSPTQTLFISPDEDDNRFLECAETSHADYLVTGNQRHFPAAWKSTRIVNSREFLALIAI